MNEATVLHPPGLLRRLAAMVYDCFLVIPLIMASVALALGVGQAIGKSPETLAPAGLVQLIVVLCSVGFFTVFWRKSGQTLGMQAWRIKLVPMPGKELTRRRCLLRCGAAALSAACLGLGYLWCIFDSNKRSWHDQLSGTELVLLAKKSKAGLAEVTQEPRN